MEDWNKADWKPWCWPMKGVDWGSISEGEPDRVFFYFIIILFILFSGFGLSKHFDGGIKYGKKYQVRLAPPTLGPGR